MGRLPQWWGMICTGAKKIARALTWRRKLCRECSGAMCIGNHGPCYSCHQGSNFEYGVMIPEPKRETGENYVYVFKGWEPPTPIHKELPRQKPCASGGRQIVIYDREYDEDGALKSFKAKFADE